MDNYIFFNNKITPLNKVFISIHDRGFLYGDGYFDTFRAFDGEFYDFKFHYSRMLRTSRFLNIPLPLSESQFINIMKDLKSKNNFDNKECYFRVTVTRGIDSSGPTIKETHIPTMVIEARGISDYINDKSQKGVKATILYDLKKSESVLYNYKTLNYLSSIVGFVNRRNYDDVIFIDKESNLIEGITANLFFYKGKTLYTSNRDDLFLKGVTREIILKGIKKFPEYKFSVRFKESGVKDLKNFDGAFFTNSVSLIYPIISIDDHKFSGRAEIISKLKEIYFKYLKE